MKLSELAREHNLDLDLLREVVEEDLKIPLPKKLETELKDTEVTVILACDGLETADGKAFTPIIAKEFEDKHKKKIATKKGLETKKRKLEADAEAKKREDDVRLDAERAKHAGELAKREAERLLKEQTDAEAAALKAEQDSLIAAEQERLRITAEDEIRRREDESKRISGELAAMRANSNDAAAQRDASASASAVSTAAPVEAPS
nr:hypothetical protein [Planctomycetota bacterium]